MSLLRLVITLHLLLLPNVMAAPTGPQRFAARARHSRPSVTSATAAPPRLAVRTRRNPGSGSPPAFMMRLYEQLTDRHGQLRQDVGNGLATHSASIWSLQNTASSRLAITPSSYIGTDLEFRFQHLPKKEDILSAQLRLFKSVTDIHVTDRVRTCSITISKLSDGQEVTVLRRETTALRSGWEIFNVTQLIESRRQDADVKLVVRVRGAFGKRGPYTPSEQQRFIDRLQPLLVVYLGRHPQMSNETHQISATKEEPWYRALPVKIKRLPKEHVADSQMLSRHERRAAYSGNSGDAATESHLCGLRRRSITFRAVGMRRVIFPKTININDCSGACDVGTDRNKQLNLTSHTVMKYLLAKKANVPDRICCVPTSFDKASLLIAEKGSFELKPVNIIATSCGCR